MKCIPYLCAVAGIVWLDLWVYGGALRSHWPMLILWGVIYCIPFWRARYLDSKENRNAAGENCGDKGGQRSGSFNEGDTAAVVRCSVRTAVVWTAGILIMIQFGLRFLNPYELFYYYCYGGGILVIIYLVLCCRGITERMLRKTVYWLGLALLAVITAAFCLGTGFSSRQQAAGMLAGEGYSNVEWVKTVEAEWVSAVFFMTTKTETTDMTAKEQQEEFYIFSGEKEQQTYCLIFSPAEHELYRAKEAESEDEIRQMFD